MSRPISSRKVALAGSGAAALLAASFWFFGSDAGARKAVATAEAAQAAEPRPETNAHVQTTPPKRAGSVTPVPAATLPSPRPRPRVAPPAVPPNDEERVIHGMTAEERREKGFTPQRLFASRSGARLRYMAAMLERDGRPELAKSLLDLSKDFAAAHEERDENKVAWGDLLTRQNEVIHEVIKVAVTEGNDDKFFLALAAKTVDDIEDAMSGNLESVDRKLGEEVSEQREKDEPTEQKTGILEPDPEDDEPEAEAGDEEGAAGDDEDRGRDDDDEK